MSQCFFREGIEQVRHPVGDLSPGGTRDVALEVSGWAAGTWVVTARGEHGGGLITGEITWPIRVGPGAVLLNEIMVRPDAPDPEWIEKRAETERDGAIVASVNNQILTPTAFSNVK